MLAYVEAIVGGVDDICVVKYTSIMETCMTPSTISSIACRACSRAR